VSRKVDLSRAMDGTLSICYTVCPFVILQITYNNWSEFIRLHGKYFLENNIFGEELKIM